MPRQHVFCQAVLVSGSMRTKGALELGIDPALEVVMTLQVVFVFVSLAANDTGMLEGRDIFRIN